MIGAKHGAYSIPVYDDGFGQIYISRNSIGINGIVRAQTWEDAYEICEDEFFSEADETIEELIKEYGFKREHKKIIRAPALQTLNTKLTMNKLSLPSGTTGFFNDQNVWTPTGSQMGRRNTLPDDRNVSPKLRLVRLRWVSGDYDQWGAYWGRNGCNHVYCAWGPTDVQIFVRGITRTEAKDKVRELLPKAKFYR